MDRDIKLALLGDHEAAKRVTDAGVLLIQGDCLELLKDIPDGSVDMVLCDLPYGTTYYIEWDIPIPFEPLWEQYHRVCKETAPIVLFGKEPFSSELRLSNKKCSATTGCGRKQFARILEWLKKGRDYRMK